MALTSTTLAAAMLAGDTKIYVTSATGFTVGYLAQIDSEFVEVVGIDGTLITIRPGVNGTKSLGHANATRITVGPYGDFQSFNPKDWYYYTAAGAIQMKPGTHVLKTGTAGAMTLADPTADLEGIKLRIIASDAQAYTVTYTAGFSANTTSSDVATFAGTKGALLEIECFQGLWICTNSVGVSIA